MRARVALRTMSGVFGTSSHLELCGSGERVGALPDTELWPEALIVTSFIQRIRSLAQLLIWMLLLLAASTAHSQWYATDNHGNVTTFQNDGAGNYIWQNNRGGHGFLFTQPSLGTGSGFGQGLLQGLHETNRQLRNLHHDLTLSQLQADMAARQVRIDQMMADLMRMSSVQMRPTLSDAHVVELARQQARQDAADELLMTMTPGQREWAQMGVAALKEGLLNVNPANDQFPCVPTQAWLDDHQHYWVGTRPEAVLAYFRSGHHDCP
jgi:hypothetical protein